jgi:hypothetical protein
MDKSRFDALEVRTDVPGWYWVTFFQFNKDQERDPDYFKDWIETDGKVWDYGGYDGKCYVCFIHKREESNVINGE